MSRSFDFAQDFASMSKDRPERVILSQRVEGQEAQFVLTKQGVCSIIPIVIIRLGGGPTALAGSVAGERPAALRVVRDSKGQHR